MNCKCDSRSVFHIDWREIRYWCTWNVKTCFYSKLKSWWVGYRRIGSNDIEGIHSSDQTMCWPTARSMKNVFIGEVILRFVRRLMNKSKSCSIKSITMPNTWLPGMSYVHFFSWISMKRHMRNRMRKRFHLKSLQQFRRHLIVIRARQLYFLPIISI